MCAHNHGAQDARVLTLTKYMHAFEYGRFDESSPTTRIGQPPPAPSTSTTTMVIQRPFSMDLEALVDQELIGEGSRSEGCV